MKEVYLMKNTITKKEIYATIKAIVNGEDITVNDELKQAILDRMDKDIELASKSATKKETDKDKENKAIQDTILEVLADGAMVYGEFVKVVQAQYPDIDLTPQRVTANVTKVKDLVEKYEDGKGKNKKLYIKLA